MGIFSQLFANGIIAGSLYGLASLGFNLVYATKKFFNLSLASFVAVGAYLTFFITNHLGIGVYAAALAAVILSGFFGYFSERYLFASLDRKKASAEAQFIASLGLLFSLQALLAIIFTSQLQLIKPTSFTGHIFEIFGAVFTGAQLLILIAATAISTVLAIFFKKTRTGCAIRAIGSEPELARVVGIDTDRLTATVFFLGAAIMGLTGSLVGLDSGLEPTMGVSLLFKAMIASIIGGVGNIYAGLGGALFLGLIENFGIWKIPAEWKDLIAFGVLILFLAARPLIKKK